MILGGQVMAQEEDRPLGAPEGPGDGAELGDALAPVGRARAGSQGTRQDHPEDEKGAED